MTPTHADQPPNPKRDSSPLKTAFTTFFILIFVVGCSWYLGRTYALSAIPEHVGVADTIPKRESTLGVRVVIPFNVLNLVANRLLPPNYSAGGNGEDACVPIYIDIPFFGRRLLRRVCAGTHYDFTATRSELAFGRSDNRLRAMANLSVDGQGGFRGFLAELSGLDAKNFKAAADVTIDAGLTLTSDWCPAISSNVAYNWTISPRVEIVSGIWVTIADLIDGKIRDALGALSGKLNSAIPCSAIKGPVEKVWHSYDIPVAIPDGPQLHILLHPKSVGSSGLIVDDTQVRLAVGILTDVEVSTAGTPAGEIIDPLPQLGTVPDAAGQLHVSIPLRIDYKVLNAVLSELLQNREFEFPVAGSLGKLTVSSVEVFPSAGKIGIGLGFSASLPGHVLNTSGTIYATANVMPDETGKTIMVSNFAYARILNNELWNVLSAVFEKQIKAQVEAKGRIDLQPMIDKAKGALTEAISDPSKTGGVKIDVGNPDGRIVSILPATDHITAVVEASGTLDTTLVDPAIVQLH